MGSYVISVSQRTGCYRHIKISSTASLYKLHNAIINAFEFDDDHEHAFFMDNRVWSHESSFFSSQMRPGDPTTRKCKIEKLGLSKGDKFKYLFDFGDEWVFQCKVLQVLDEATPKPVVLRSVGEAPEQYPEYDDEFDESDDDWEDNEFVPLATRLKPDVLEKLYDTLPIEKEIRICLHRYYDAAARLYGVIPVSKLLEIYNHQNEPIDEDVFYAFAEILRHEENDFFILSCQEVKHGEGNSNPKEWEVIDSYLLAEGAELYSDFVGMQGKKKYKILPKDEFLCYANPKEIPSYPQSEAMLNYLKKKKHLLQFSPEEVCWLIRMMISIDCCLQETLEYLTGVGLQFDSAGDMEAFMQRYQELNNHTRKQVNRGYTPDELVQEYSESIPRTKPCILENQISMFEESQNEPKILTLNTKVGRNDLCPCGSGLKYKKCCGKLN